MKPDPIPGLLIGAILALIYIALTGCGTERDTQTKTVERLTTTTGPVVVDTPIGQFVAQPIRHEMTRSEEAVETQSTRISMPEASAVIQAAANATPWGGIISGVIGMGVAAFAGKKALDTRRQRNELIAGVERAKGDLPPDSWGVLTKHLEAEQNADTKAAVAARTK